MFVGAFLLWDPLQTHVCRGSQSKKEEEEEVALPDGSTEDHLCNWDWEVWEGWGGYKLTLSRLVLTTVTFLSHLNHIYFTFIPHVFHIYFRGKKKMIISFIFHHCSGFTLKWDFSFSWANNYMLWRHNYMLWRRNDPWNKEFSTFWSFRGQRTIKQGAL